MVQGFRVLVVLIRVWDLELHSGVEFGFCSRLGLKVMERFKV